MALREAALYYARNGIPVFPCVVNGKEPAFKGSFANATTDEDTINGWWQQADFNIGFSPEASGFCVLDPDPSGLEAWHRLLSEHGQQDTTQVVTPRGGRHVYYLGSLPSRSPASSAIPGIDSRGKGGYVLLPPSFVLDTAKGIKGAYVWCADDFIELPPAPLPAWAKETFGVRKVETRKASEGIVLDSELAISAATTLAKNRPLAEGNGSDFRTICLLNEIGDLGVSQERAVAIVHEHCPTRQANGDPFTLDWIKWKAESAYRSRQNEIGSDAPIPTEQKFSASISSEDAENKGPNLRVRFPLWTIEELPAKLAPPSWIIPDFIPKHGTVQFTGAPKSFKTFLALDLCLGIAAGVETFGVKPTQYPVIYAVGENPATFGLNAIPAWKLARDVTGPIPFRMIPAVPKAIDQTQWAEFIGVVKTVKPAIVVLDTATRALRGLDENSAQSVGIFSDMCDTIRDETGATVLVIRHTGKDIARGSRGSNVIEGDFDTIVDVLRDAKSKLVEVRVREQRNAEERPEPYYFEATHFSGSLIMTPVERKEFEARTDYCTIPKVLQALATADAWQDKPDHTISTKALASILTASNPKDLKEAEDSLKALARSLLRSFTTGEGSSLQWFVPVVKPNG